MKNVSSLSAIFALALSVSTSATAHATQPLETFIERASSASFDARESAVQVGQKEAEADAALGALLPALSARGVYTHNQYQPMISFPYVDMAGMLQTSPPIAIQKYNVFEGFLQLDVPIVNISNYHRYKAQQALSQSTTERRAATTLDVGRNVAGAYFRFLGASALVRSAELSVKATEDNLRVVQARREAGAATDLDRERALANVERARQDVADAELTRDLAARQLETLSNLTPTPAEGFPADDLHPEAPIQNWLTQASETPLAKAARSAQTAAHEAQKAADTALYPTLSGSAVEHVTNSAGLQGSTSAYTLQLVAQIRFDYATLATSRAQAFAAQASGIQSERTSRSLQDATFEAYRRVETGIVKSRAARSQATAAARASSLSSERYAAGVATQLDVTQAQRDAFLADASRILADSDLAAARAQLRLSVGQAPSATQNNVELSPESSPAVAPAATTPAATTTPTSTPSAPTTPATPPATPARRP